MPFFKNRKNKIKVISCAEFECPFHFCGHMGGSFCLATNNMRRLDQYPTTTGPDWCPLKTGPIKVTL